MSAFGDGTFKQNVYEELTYQIGTYSGSKPQAISELMEVLAYLVGSAFNRDEEIARVKTEAYEQAKKDIIKQLK